MKMGQEALLILVLETLLLISPGRRLFNIYSIKLHVVRLIYIVARSAPSSDIFFLSNLISILLFTTVIDLSI